MLSGNVFSYYCCVFVWNVFLRIFLTTRKKFFLCSLEKHTWIMLRKNFRIYYVNHIKCTYELPQLCFNFALTHSSFSLRLHNCIISLCCTYPKSININFYRILKNLALLCMENLISIYLYMCGTDNRWL